MTKLIRLGNTEFNLVFANFCEKYLDIPEDISEDIKKIRLVYTDWIYKTAGYYDKNIEIQDFYRYPDSFTSKLDQFVDSMGKALFNFDRVFAISLDSFKKNRPALSRYIPAFEEYYSIKLLPYNIDAKSGISLIQNTKKVLVVSPFKELIDQQITSGNLRIIQPSLRDIEFITYKFPYTFLNDGPHQDSIETLDNISKDIIENYKNFDIAILSCGCYGTLLTNTICHTMNKNALYIGGQLPLIFGIVGKRDHWAIEQIYSQYKQHLVCPIPETYRPKNYDKIEGGCYW